jgi:vacuolar iron transporter family protein
MPVARRSNHVVPKGWPATLRHYVGDLVYGANDGLVTTFAAVAGVEGGALSPTTVLIVGMANLVADGLSMGIGNYLSIRAREQAREVEDLPQDEAQPARHGLATFLAFSIVGAVPLAPYTTGTPLAWRAWASAGLTLATLFGVGAARGVVTKRAWWSTGGEVLALGATAGAVAFAAGKATAWILVR